MACRVTPAPTGQQAEGSIEVREFGTLTRDRTKLVQERTREVNRVQGVLERANIKLASVAHAIAVSAFSTLSRNEPYRELGANYFDEHRRQHMVDRLIRGLQHLGYCVNLEPVPAA